MGVLEGYTQLANTIMKGFGDLAKTKEQGAETAVETERIKANERIRQSDPAVQEKQYMSQMVPVNLKEYMEPGNADSVLHISDDRVRKPLAQLFNKAADFDPVTLNLVKQDGMPVMIPRWFKEKMQEPATGIILSNFDIEHGLDSRIGKLEDAFDMASEDKRPQIKAELDRISKARSDPATMQMHYEDYVGRLNKAKAWAIGRKAAPAYIKMIDDGIARAQQKIADYEPVKFMDAGGERFWKSYGETEWHRLPTKRERGDAPSAEEAIKQVMLIDKDINNAYAAGERAAKGFGLNDMFISKFMQDSGQTFEQADIQGIRQKVKDFTDMRIEQRKYFEQFLPKSFPKGKYSTGAATVAPAPEPVKTETNDPLTIRKK